MDGVLERLQANEAEVGRSGIPSEFPRRDVRNDLEASVLAADVNRVLLLLARNGWQLAFRHSDRVQSGSGLWTADARVVTFERETRRGVARENRLGILVRSPSEMRTPAALAMPRTDVEHLAVPEEANLLVDTLNEARARNPRPVLHFADGMLLDLRAAQIAVSAWTDGHGNWVEVSVDGSQVEKPNLYFALL